AFSAASGAGAAGSSVAGSSVASVVYTAISPTREDGLRISPGLRAQVLVGFGDPLFTGDAGLTARDMRSLKWLDADAAARQERRFSTNSDALAFFPSRTRRDAGLLCVNHEYVEAELVFAGVSADEKIRARDRDAWIRAHPEAIAWMRAAHGVSVLEVRKGLRGWQVVKGAKATRRITADTPMDISGPARGAPLMRTVADPTGTRALGTFANCAGGKTPWGTYLTAEENIQDYFGGARSWAAASTDEATKQAHRRWPLRERSAYGWDLLDARFDVRQEPREALRHGWIVEIDPEDPTSTPKKRTALGRFCHEGANTILTKDGRVAAYMGDDTKFEYVYKFVTRDRFDPKIRAANRDLLDHGTLYAARFDTDGRGEWLPLVHDENGPLNSRAGFSSQAEVVIRCREAADV
ncbi:MAG: PhoX family protein, partial [Gammaproteobacteria bacterium]